MKFGKEIVLSAPTSRLRQSNGRFNSLMGPCCHSCCRRIFRLVNIKTLQLTILMVLVIILIVETMSRMKSFSILSNHLLVRAVSAKRKQAGTGKQVLADGTWNEGYSLWDEGYIFWEYLYESELAFLFINTNPSTDCFIIGQTKSFP